jgi:hypothetical protein
MTDKKVLSKTELESVIRGGKWNSQSDANSYLQKHGLSCQMKDDGTAEIFQGEGASNRVAKVAFQSSEPSSGAISNITTY